MMGLIGEDSNLTKEENSTIDKTFYNCNSTDILKQINDHLVINCKLKQIYIKQDTLLSTRIFDKLIVPPISYIAGFLTGGLLAISMMIKKLPIKNKR